MDNAVKIRILGIEFAVTSPDGAQHAKNIAAAVDAKTEEIINDDPGLSVSKAAIIAAMDFCEGEMKFHRIALKLKKRILKNEEELARLSRNANNEEYENEIASLEKELKKRAQELLILKEDITKLEEYKRALSEKEIEAERLSRRNEELERELEETQNRLAEMEADYVSVTDDDDDFELEDDIEDFGLGKFQTIAENEESALKEEDEDSEDETYSADEEDASAQMEDDGDDDIIIPGYLDDGEEDYEEENVDEDRLANPFGLDFSDR